MNFNSKCEQTAPPPGQPVGHRSRDMQSARDHPVKFILRRLRQCYEAKRERGERGEEEGQEKT